MADFGAVVHTEAGGIIDVPHPRQVITKAPIVALYFGIAISVTITAANGSRYGGTEVGVLAQMRFGVLRNQPQGHGMLFIELIRHRGLDGDGLQTQFIQVVAQYRISLVFGARAKRYIDTQAQSHVIIELM